MFGISSYGFLRRRVGRRGRPRRGHATASSGSSADGAVDATSTSRSPRCTRSGSPATASVVAIGAGPRDGAILVRLDAADRRGARRARAVAPRARSTRPTSRSPSRSPSARRAAPPPGRSTSRRPTRRSAARTASCRRCIVESHGGPTGAAYSALSLDRAFFTSRGIAVVDVDYRGSSGYGRPYRDALKGQWGIADVEDCVAAAEFLVARGSVDGARLAIRGGSAGGYTTLAALTFRPEVFAAGISHFGIADLELIHNDGHKFESRYDEGLLAPWTEEGRRVFRERSPIHYLDRVRAPMLIFQGLDDRVVPPSQLDAMEAALRAARHPVRRDARSRARATASGAADSRRATYEAELAFLGRVFGFTPDDDVPPLEIPGSRRSRRRWPARRPEGTSADPRRVPAPASALPRPAPHPFRR